MALVLTALRDETTVLALNGIAKVLRSHMGSMLVMEGFDDKWNGLMDICAKVLAHGRKNVAVAAAQLLTGVLLVSYGYTQLQAFLAFEHAANKLNVSSAKAVLMTPHLHDSRVHLQLSLLSRCMCPNSHCLYHNSRSAHGLKCHLAHVQRVFLGLSDMMPMLIKLFAVCC